MRWIQGLVVIAALGAVVPLASAEDAVRWTSDFRQACDVAHEQGRLVLLHFYSDNCPPCARFDKEVFSQPQVGEALARYCVPMKVHVEQSPELARKYNIQRWPTDVLVTPAGLEVYRSVGFRSAVEYLTMIEQVALHAGARPAAGGQVPITAAAPPQASPYPGPYQGGPIAGSYQSQLPPSDRNVYESSLGQATHQNLDTSRQPFEAAAGQPAGEALPVAPVGNPMGPMSSTPQPQPSAYAAQPTPEGGSRYFQPQAAAQPSPEAPPAAGSIYQNPAPPAAPPAPQQPIMNRYTQQAAPPSVATPPAYGAQQPLAQSPPPQAAGVAPAATAPPAPASSAGPYSTQPPFENAAAAPVGPAAIASAPAAPPMPPQSPMMVPASAAPPIVLDGCCAVTMVETRKLKKADPQFGAVHRGRTYLFVSVEQQTKFLADPDRYAVILSGYDPVRFAKTGELVEGKREFGMMYQQKIYLMADEESLNQFSASPQFYSTSAHQAMLKTEMSGTQFR